MKKDLYEQPTINIIEFKLEDSIASSGDLGPGTICTEEM